MPASAGVVLVGGRSSRMGAPKAALEWHGSTLLWRTVCILRRATGGPVVVVGAPGQNLPELPPNTEVVADANKGLGPVQGIAAGLAALSGRADVAFIAATDLPFLHPAFVRCVIRAALTGPDVALPVARGFRQPLAAAYRTALAPLASQLLTGGLVNPAQLFARCKVAALDQDALLADRVLAAVDPVLDSVVNVNYPGEYAAARARPAPEVTVYTADGSGGVRSTDGVNSPGFGELAAPEPRAVTGRDRQVVRAATVAEAATAVGVVLDSDVTATVNGELTTCDGRMPVVAGDTVIFQIAGAER